MDWLLCDVFIKDFGFTAAEGNSLLPASGLEWIFSNSLGLSAGSMAELAMLGSRYFLKIRSHMPKDGYLIDNQLNVISNAAIIMITDIIVDNHNQASP